MPTTLSPEEHERRLELYNRKMTDLDISIRRGVSPAAIQKWRDKNSLPPNGKPVKPSIPKVKHEYYQSQVKRYFMQV